MKVCLLNDSFPPIIDGVANVVLNYANHLTRDHRSLIMVGTPRYPNIDYGVHPFPVVAYSSLNIGKLVEGYRAGNPFHEKSMIAMSHFQPEIIHTHCPAMSSVMGRILRDVTGAPLIFTYHTKFDVDIKRSVKSDFLVKQAVKLMLSNIEPCDEVWVVSRGAGENLTGLGYTGEWFVMPNGVDFAKGGVSDEAVREATKDYDLPEDIPVYLFVGRLMNYKGLPIILDALKILADEGKDFRMVFVGKGDDEESVKDKARELGLMDNPSAPDKCIFTGPIYDRNELRAWNTRADLFFFMSTYDTNGLVVREAAACGLASVLVEGSCAAEDITDGRNGFMVEENAESLAAFLLENGDNLELLRQTGQHAMEEIYKSWEDCVALAYDRYQYVLDTKKAGLLPSKKSAISGKILKRMSHDFQERERIRTLSKAFFQNINEKADSMRDNISDLSSTVSDWIEDWYKMDQ